MAPAKEVHFFDAPDYDGTWSREEVERRYHTAFPNYRGEAHVGEATPIYLFLPEVAPRIRRYNPAMKLIVLLRDPAARALSHYHMERGRGDEWLPAPWAFLLEPWRRWRGGDFARRHHSYLARGFYSGQLQRLARFFPRQQILVLASEDLRYRHRWALKRVHEFLQLRAPEIIPPGETVFAGHYPRQESLLRCLRWLYRRERRRYAPWLERPYP